MKQIALSGIKPTGTLHIGNYLGMIKPAFDLIENFQTLYFVADYHALTTLKDSVKLNQYVYDVAATLLALGSTRTAVVPNISISLCWSSTQWRVVLLGKSN